MTILLVKSWNPKHFLQTYRLQIMTRLPVPVPSRAPVADDGPLEGLLVDLGLLFDGLLYNYNHVIMLYKHTKILEDVCG